MGIHSKLQNVYYSMKTRCYNEKAKPYKNYGARGIVVCKEWRHSYENFAEWAKLSGYSEGLTLDRIDVNGNYSPDNCRWVSAKVQQNNKRNNIRLTYKGCTKTLTEWADELNIPYDCLLTRVRRYGFDAVKVLFTPNRRKLIEYEDRKQHLSDWCRELHLNYNKVNLRLNRGWSVEQAFETKIRRFANGRKN